MRIDEQDSQRTMDVLQRPKELISEVISAFRQGESVNYVSGHMHRLRDPSVSICNRAKNNSRDSVERSYDRLHGDWRNESVPCMMTVFEDSWWPC